MKYSKNIFLVTLVYILLMNSSFIQAQFSDSLKLPSLDNQVFTSIAGVEDPFISTKFAISIGLANLINTEIPITIPSTSRTVIFKPDLFYTVGGIEYQHAVKHWVAIHLKAGGLARVGDNAVSIATQGISAASFVGVGLKFKITQNEKLSLAYVIDLNTSSITFINFSGKFEDIVADSSSEVQVINNFETVAGNMQLKFAYRFSKVFGFLSNLNGSFGEIYAKVSENEFNWSFGALLNVDFRNWIHIPFGLAFGGTIISNDWQYSNTNDPVYTVNLNISFINQNDFMIGLENYLQMVHQERFDKTFNFHYTRISLSYYF